MTVPPGLLVGVAGFVALLLPAPIPVSLAGLVTVAGLVALVGAVRRPGSLAPLVLIGLAVISWLDVDSPGTFRTVTFAGAVFAVHSTASFAAAVPLGARLEGDVVLRWTVRAGLTLAAGLGLVALTAPLGAPPGSTARTALAVAVSTVLLLPAAILVIRRSPAEVGQNRPS